MELDSIVGKIEESRKELLDLGLRNPLLNYRTLKASGVKIVDEIPSAVFDILVRKGREMSFLPRPDDDKDYELGQPQDDAESDTPSRRHIDNRLQTNETSDQLQSRLLKTHHTANTVIQEQGVNTLFVALGMVEWYEADASHIARRAPMILIPVKIERSAARSKFYVQYTGEELGGNLSFIEKVRADFPIEIPGLPDAEDLDVDRYFSDVSLLIKDMKRWSVDRTSVVLGFFSFSKLLMYRDLDVKIWPEGFGPLESDTIRALFGGGVEAGFKEPAPAIGEDGHLDEHLRPEDVHHVVDADSSQALAILDVSNGRNLVIQGPPGTGKSQTITNIIADAVSQNKKVLFVSEKMAALEVVKRRLDDLDLGDACLELHSHKTTKRTVLDELKKTLAQGRPSVERLDDDFIALGRIRDSLNEYAEAVNSPIGDTGVTPFDAFGQRMRVRGLDSDGNPLRQPVVAGIDSWPRLEFDEKRSVVAHLQDCLARVGVLRNNAFWGSRLRIVLPSDTDLLHGSVSAATESLESLVHAAGALGCAMRLSPPERVVQAERLRHTAEHLIGAPDFRGVNLGAPEWKDSRNDIRELRELGTQWARLHDEYDAILIPDAWGANVGDIRRTLDTTGRRFFRFLSPKHRRAKKQLAMMCQGELPGYLKGQLAVADAIIEERQLGQAIDRLSPTASAALGRLWREERTDWEAASLVMDWMLELFAGINEERFDPGIVTTLDEGLETGGLPEPLKQYRDALDTYRDRMKSVMDSLEMDVEKRFCHPDGLAALPFKEQGNILAGWSRRMHDIQDIAAVNNALVAAEKEGLHALAELAEERPNMAAWLTNCFDLARYDGIVRRAFSERPALASFDFGIHGTRLEDFRRMDSLVLDHNRVRVARTHWNGLPNHSGAGQLQILRREFEKKSRHLPIRQLMNKAGNPIQAIKPVFMMSPMSIASYLEPGGVSFDLVVFDEASQVKPVDALGALIRADKSVVVGDDRQLPPTSFFDSITQSEDEEDENSVTADIESILGLMRAAGCPDRMLRWHYRSRHESLIAVSNHEFYNNELVVFPSPDSGRQGSGLQYHHNPNSVYDRGRSRTNRKEAEEVAASVMEHARQHPDLTIGVAAFSTAQMQAILDELEKMRRQDTSCESFFGAHPEEPFFVKNLENVQGDERDVIFISVGYGRDANGAVSMNFGPLNKGGGERRLNVIITRAKRRCHVFTNLHADDIRLDGPGSAGLRAFKMFLAYAESGNLPTDIPEASKRDMDSPFQKEVVSRLRALGHEAHEEVASGGKFVDIAVVDPERPGRYLIGVECDGASYHSSRSARDRDKIREQHLKDLGWKLHRIWSTDWFRNPDRELKRTVEAIEQAKAAHPAAHTVGSRARPEIKRIEADQEPSELSVPAYETAQPHVDTRWYELHDVPTGYLHEPIIEVVRVEGPVHVSEVARRIADAAGVSRIGARIRANLERAISNAARGKNIVKRGDFLWPADMNLPVLRDRSAVILQHKKIELIAPEEIAVAVTVVVERSYGIDRADACAAAGRLLGFKSVSKKIRARIDRVIEDLIRKGDLDADGDQIKNPD